MPTLVILRHAKSDWPPGVPDERRPLGPRGLRDAPEAGRWLASVLPHHPDLAVVSSAERTRQTWALAGEAWGGAVPVREAPEVYAADRRTLLDVVQEIPDTVATAVLVGHNPGCEQLAASLAGPGSDAVGLADMAYKYPTSGAAILYFDRPWSDVTTGSGVLTAFAVPRG